MTNSPPETDACTATLVTDGEPTVPTPQAGTLSPANVVPLPSPSPEPEPEILGRQYLIRDPSTGRKKWFKIKKDWEILFKTPREWTPKVAQLLTEDNEAMRPEYAAAVLMARDSQILSELEGIIADTRKEMKKPGVKSEVVAVLAGRLAALANAHCKTSAEVLKHAKEASAKPENRRPKNRPPQLQPPGLALQANHSTINITPANNGNPNGGPPRR
jgi:hypothetical protein